MKNHTDRLRALGSLFVKLGPDADAAYAEADLDAPEPRIRRRFELDVLTPGGAVSLLPVESLYETWIDPRTRRKDQPCAFGGAKHLYLGDSAHHVMAIFRELEIDIPEGFEAMPDHIALLCELAAIFGDAGNRHALECLLSDHFGWIDSYMSELSFCKSELSGAPKPNRRTRECAEAVGHALELLAEIKAEVSGLIESDSRELNVSANASRTEHLDRKTGCAERRSSSSGTKQEAA